MERENYYLLLELSVDPPENDPKVIQEAIKTKQSQWSRYRNHPTKSVQAKQYIGMIPDIRKVMTDPDLRKKEADEAKGMLKNQVSEKFEKIDRHIALLISKGIISKTEIAGLSKIDSVEEADILDRIKKNEKSLKLDREIRLLINKGKIGNKKIANLAKKYAVGEEKIRDRITKTEEDILAEIDKYLEYCREQDYLSENIIEKLAKIYSVKESLIMSRIKSPIKPEDPDRKFKRAKPLDKSLEKLIEDNLKIVGCSSLYEFLEVSQESNLEFLQEISKEKEMDIRKIGQKDAVMTAGSFLAGHCIVIFKTKKSRSAYDLTLKRSRLKELDSDIVVAGMDKKIRPEYFEFLIQKAISLGMDIEEAFDYVHEYCENEKIAVEERKRLFAVKKGKIIFMEKWAADLDPKKPSFWALVGAAVVIFIMIAVSINLTGNMIQAARLKSAYENVMSSLEKEQDLEKKEKVLKTFLNSYSDTKYAAAFNEKIGEIHKEIETRDYELTAQNAKPLYEKKKYEDLKVVYEKYLNQYPQSIYAAKIKKEIAEIPGLIDDRDFEALKAVADKDYSEKLMAYNWYAEKHPDGKHISDVKKLVMEMVSQYYDLLKQDLNTCEKEENWQKCIQFCKNFIEKFKVFDQAGEVEGLKIKYEKRLGYEADLTKMNEQVNEFLKEYDFEAAKMNYSAYLNAYSELPAYMKEKVTRALERVEEAHQTFLDEEKEWEKLILYVNDTLPDLPDKIKKMKDFIQKSPSGRHTEEANLKLSEMEGEYGKWVVLKKEEEQSRQWFELLAFLKNPKLNLSGKIQKIETFVRQYPTGMYIQNAKDMLEQLKKEKSTEEERIRRKKEILARILKEKEKMIAIIKKSGNRFVYNGNETVTDKTTGLMWTLLDSSVEVGECIDYQTAGEYISKITVGGYKDWRLPTVNELVNIYKTKPFFPSGGAEWYWTSDIIWHGWNKKVNIVNTKPETVWNKEQVELFQCGWVRAVR